MARLKKTKLEINKIKEAINPANREPTPVLPHDYGHNVDKKPNKLNDQQRWMIMASTSLVALVALIIMILVVTNVI
ncbi:hypothetical protein J2Z62_000083 [Mycoplasmoides fastidiosum]|uniref:Uncharacterized protein n=1 Tax=Mycoplasmoides fastidiosum TaxID=92758 RepID=A0ABU0LYF9_9BACT|nr:hypothetical protein [Mycoplasmoides fastidiosum]MDQ0513645.1 hypothetical protein [Mycoplasmoides fastidiosum]UUD37935.1 hypothetical protein NPA10_00870 [Mycoplasmoides fastidiosum]